MAYLVTRKTGAKIVFGILVFGAQAPARGMQLFAGLRAGVKKSACSPFILHELVLRNQTLHKAASSPAQVTLNSRIFSSSRANCASQESWLAGQELLLKKAAKQAEELVATIRLAQVRLDEQMHGEKPEPALEKLKNRKWRAELGLKHALDQHAGAQQWVRLTQKAVIDSEHKYDGDTSVAAQKALADAHKDAREAGMRVSKMQKLLDEAQQELVQVREELKAAQVEPE